MCIVLAKLTAWASFLMIHRKGYPLMLISILRWLLVITATLTLAGRANAGVVYESATLGTTGQSGGLFLASDFLVGSWFSLSESTQITALGGHAAVSNGSADDDTLWVAVIELQDGALPTFNVNDIETHAKVSGLLTHPLGFGSSRDLRTNVNAVLGPGDYAILIGGGFSFNGNVGLFGATTSGVMARSNTDLPGSQYFGYTSSGGWDNTIDRTRSRLIVEGVTAAVPEPSSLSLLVVAGLGALVCRRRK